MDQVGRSEILFEFSPHPTIPTRETACCLFSPFDTSCLSRDENVTFDNFGVSQNSAKKISLGNEMTPLSTKMFSSMDNQESSPVSMASGFSSPMIKKVQGEALPANSPLPLTRLQLLREENFGFPVTAALAAHIESATYKKSCVERTERWEAFIEQNPEFGNPFDERAKLVPGSKSWRHVRDLCRLGIPKHKRRAWWQALSGSVQKRRSSPIEYIDLLAASEDNTTMSAQDIEKDLRRTFPDHTRFRSTEGQDELRRVLRAYSARNAEVGYCQSMNFVAGTLLLFLNEEEAFWTLCAILEDRMPCEFYSRSMTGLRVDIAVFEKLVEQELPRLNDHLISLGVLPQSFVAQCFACLFINVLPIGTALRVWDAFLCEGTNVLFRTALALLRMKEKELMQLADAALIHQLLFAYPKSVHDADVVMQMAFEDQGPSSFDSFSPMRHIKTRLGRKKNRRLTISIQELRKTHRGSPKSSVVDASPQLPPKHSLQQNLKRTINAPQATFRALREEIMDVFTMGNRSGTKPIRKQNVGGRNSEVEEETAGEMPAGARPSAESNSAAFGILFDLDSQPKEEEECDSESIDGEGEDQFPVAEDIASDTEDTEFDFAAVYRPIPDSSGGESSMETSCNDTASDLNDSDFSLLLSGGKGSNTTTPHKLDSNCTSAPLLLASGGKLVGSNSTTPNKIGGHEILNFIDSKYSAGGVEGAAVAGTASRTPRNIRDMVSFGGASLVKKTMQYIR